MGGMAAGAAWCARRSARLANPLAAYAAVEAVIGLAALVFHPLFVGAHRLVVRLAAARPRAANGSRSRAKLALSCAADPAAVGAARHDLPADERRPGARASAARRRIAGDALLHQQPRRRGRRAGERLRAHRLGRPAGHAAHRRRPEPRHRRSWCGCSRGRRGMRPLRRSARRGEPACGCCSRSPSSPASRRSSTRSAGSACCRWCSAPRRIRSS